MAYLGLFGQASHSHRDRAVFARSVLKRGHCINGPITKIFRKDGK